MSTLIYILFLMGVLAQGAHIYGPLLPGDFPDPTIIFVKDSYYAFSSRNLNNHQGNTTNIPMASSTQFTSGWQLLEGDALPDPGKWTASVPEVLTPDVNQLADGTFIMYYIAIPKNNPLQEHCIGAATATVVTGPYTPQSTPLLCPKADQQGVGTADPNGFVYRGTPYIVFKNASGHDPQHQSYIAIEQVQQNGYTAASPWTDIINSTAKDDNDVEAPCLVANPDTSASDKFVLFFTTGTFNTTTLKIEYAYASDVDGPYSRQGTLLESAVYGGVKISGPVGPDIVPSNASQAVFESFATDANGNRIRALYAVELEYGNNTVKIA